MSKETRKHVGQSPTENAWISDKTNSPDPLFSPLPQNDLVQLASRCSATEALIAASSPPAARIEQPVPIQLSVTTVYCPLIVAERTWIHPSASMFTTLSLRSRRENYPMSSPNARTPFTSGNSKRILVAFAAGMLLAGYLGGYAYLVIRGNGPGIIRYDRDKVLVHLHRGHSFRMTASQYFFFYPLVRLDGAELSDLDIPHRSGRWDTWFDRISGIVDSRR